MGMIFVRAISVVSTILALMFLSMSVAAREPSIMVGDTEIPLYKASFALVIGVSNYKNWRSLPNVATETAEVVATLRRQGFVVRYVVDPPGDLLQASFRDFFADFGRDPDNRLLIFYSGHGHSIGETGYLVPIDAPDPATDPATFQKRAQSMSALVTASREYKARHALYVFDSCFSGAVFSTRTRSEVPTMPIGQENLSRYLMGPAAFPVRQFITAGTATQRVPEVSQFTPLFIRAIDGRVDELNKSGIISAKRLGLWLSTELLLYKTNQTPLSGTILDTRLDQGDFVFGVPPPNKPIRPAVEQSEISGAPKTCFRFNDEEHCD